MGWRVNTEHREHRRVSVELPMRFAILNARGEPTGDGLHAITTNISSSGIAFFVTGLSIPIQTRLRLEMNLPGIAENLNADGTVVRIVGEEPQRNGYEYGVKLDKAEPQEALERFIRSIDIYPLLKLMAKQGATDMHLSVSAPPMLRINRNLVPTTDKPLSADTVESLIQGVISPRQRRELNRRRDVSFPYTLPEVGRWQIHAFFQRGFLEATFRTINREVPTLEQLGLPEIAHEFAQLEDGLLIVCGPLASGKSTTLASIIGAINRESRRTIMTLEDPIEYSFENERCIIRQREVGRDTRSFSDGLKHAIAQDPDVIMVGHVPDADTAELLLRIAETGRLVLVAIHANDSIQALERLASLVPPAQRQDALHAISNTIRGVVFQRLLPLADGRGLALASEVIAINDGIRNAIRTDKIDQIPNLLRSVPGAQPMDASLRGLVMRRLVDVEVASLYAMDPDRLRKATSELRA